VYTAAPKPAAINLAPVGSPEPDADGRRPVGVVVDGVVRRGFPTPSGRLEFFSPTLWDWGWREAAVPDYPRSHVHPAELAADEMVLISTFRLPVQIHTRGGNAKWLDEIAHTNPLWIHPLDARRLGVGEGELVRVETEIGYFVVKTWVTEGIRPGVVACSHHMGRWKLGDVGQRQVMATVALDHRDDRWAMKRKRGGGPFKSADPDTARIWWTDVGVHQNLTFPVHPDPVSGQHCWHQAVRVRRADPTDSYGDIAVDTARSHAAYRRWLTLTRPAPRHSPDGTRRPYWLMRPLKPARDVYDLPSNGHERAGTDRGEPATPGRSKAPLR
jgi:anaerobic selenocysteine-containing dehydrogenase